MSSSVLFNNLCCQEGAMLDLMLVPSVPRPHMSHSKVRRFTC